jgi:hypothetical protein
MQNYTMVTFVALACYYTCTYWEHMVTFFISHSKPQKKFQDLSYAINTFTHILRRLQG